MILDDVIKFMDMIHSDDDNDDVEEGSEVNFVNDD